MKIYFEDGPLLSKGYADVDYDYLIDAKNGYTFCEDKFERVKFFHPDKVVYTNSLVGLTSQYAWNESLGVHEIYMRGEDTYQFTRIDELTPRKLRQGHNIMRLFIAGEFHSERR